LRDAGPSGFERGLHMSQGLGGSIYNGFDTVLRHARYIVWAVVHLFEFTAETGWLVVEEAVAWAVGIPFPGHVAGTEDADDAGIDGGREVKCAGVVAEKEIGALDECRGFAWG